jgi:cytochrome bd ubiquinol oxidase subunit I
MQDILAARAQMGMSLAFHIVFACAGVGTPLLMVICRKLPKGRVTRSGITKEK